MAEVRQHRVAAFCDWLDSIPPAPPFHTRPEFRFYADLTDDEFEAATAEMRRRGACALEEVGAREAARLVPARDLTPRQEGVIEALADVALAETVEVLDAAEMLVGAASLILLRSYAPAVAVDLLAHLIRVTQETLKEQIQ